MVLMGWNKLLVSFVAGACLVTAFAPFNYFLLAFLSVSVLLYLWRDASPKFSFWLGLSFGYGLYGFGVSWVYVSLSTYGGMPLWMGSIAVFGFAGLLAFFTGLVGYFAARWFPKRRLIVLPLLWVVQEWTKSWMLTGFPWLDVGYTQTLTWLMAWAPIGGIYLVSFMVVAIAACIVIAVEEGQSRSKSSFNYIAGIGVILLLSWCMALVQWSNPIGREIAVGVVQPNTPIESKWLASTQSTLISKLAALSSGVNQSYVQDAQGSTAIDLIVWPETALPLYVQQTNATFWQSVKPKGSALLTGIMDSPNRDNPEEIYNAAILSCENQQTTVYRKNHLVPFGEYLPLRFAFNWVLEYLQLPMSDLSPWQGRQALNCGDSLKIGLSICYEDAFAAEYRANVGDATLLVNISEDAWFGDSLAPHQRTQMAQMRAAELSRPLVRSANSGPSLLIDHKGKVITQTSQFTSEAKHFMVQPHDGETPFKQFGNWIVWLSLLVLSLLLFLAKKQ